MQVHVLNLDAFLNYDTSIFLESLDEIAEPIKNDIITNGFAMVSLSGQNPFKCVSFIEIYKEIKKTLDFVVNNSESKIELQRKTFQYLRTPSAVVQCAQAVVDLGNQVKFITEYGPSLLQEFDTLNNTGNKNNNNQAVENANKYNNNINKK